MARRRIYWHIGPDDLGTRFLADALDVRREELAAAGVLVPGTTSSWEMSSVELRRSHQPFGYRRREVDGQSAALVRRIWKHRGTSVLSTPGLAAATPDQVALALDALRGVEIHLVLVVRDLAGQAYAAAQGALELGATSPPEAYVARVLGGDPEHQQARAFRAGHELPDILRRWSRTVLPEHVHVIAESEPDRIWGRLTALLGADVALPDDLPGEQLGLPQLAVLREVALALDGRLDAHGRRTALRDWLSRDLLTTPGTPHLPAVDGMHSRDGWTDYVTRKGFDMQGSLSTTRSSTPATVGPSSQQLATTALADAVAEVARLRAENEALVSENTRLERKRRKHKKRAEELRLNPGSGGGGGRGGGGPAPPPPPPPPPPPTPLFSAAARRRRRGCAPRRPRAGNGWPGLRW
jgi:hypothetical protein